MAKKNKFYVVWKGAKPGVYSLWSECEQQIKGFEGAKYKSFDTIVESNREFAKPSFAKSTAVKSSVQTPSFVYPSICVDAACSGNPGLMEYRGVDSKTKQEIFKNGPYPDATNNIGEFLAIVHALAYMKKKQIKCPIYSDSMTALSWIKKRKAKTKLEPSVHNEPVFDLIHRAEFCLENNTIEVPLLKLPTEIWGEIPADFGKK